MALALHEYCQGDDSFDIGKFQRVLRGNGIEWDLDRNKHGWTVRLRMNGRQKLAALARKTGFIVIGDKKIHAPGAK